MVLPMADSITSISTLNVAEQSANSTHGKCTCSRTLGTFRRERRTSASGSLLSCLMDDGETSFVKELKPYMPRQLFGSISSETMKNTYLFNLDQIWPKFWYW